MVIAELHTTSAAISSVREVVAAADFSKMVSEFKGTSTKVS
jgi:hypothetical protein